MSYSIINGVRSYRDEVETKRKQNFEISRIQGGKEEDENSRSQLAQKLEDKRFQLANSIAESAKKNDSQWEKPYWQELEVLSRRLAIAIPQNQDDFLAALRWISQQGKEKQDFDLIKCVQSNLPYDSEEIRALLDRAEENILGRLPTCYRYLIFCGSDTQAFGENVKNVKVVYRYPAFTIVEADEQTIDQLRNYYPIETLSPVDPPPPSEELNMRDQKRDQKVRFSAPILEEWKQQIEAIGSEVKILRPLGHRTLVVSVPDATSLEQIKNLKDVQDVSPYVPEIQVRKQYLELLGQEATEEAIAEARLHAVTQQDGSKLASPIPGLLTANFFTTADRDQAETRLTTQGIQIVSRPGKTRLTIDLAGHPSAQTAIEFIAEQVGLRSLEEKQLETPSNNVARQIIGEGVIPSNPHPGNALGLTGEGEVLAVADTGLDTGELSTLHLDFQGRVQSIRSFPIADSWSNRVSNPGDDDGAADDYSGHGTHVAGSLVGGGEQAQASNLSPIKGVAPGAKLVFQAIEQTPKWTPQAKLYYWRFGKTPPVRPLWGIPDELEELFAHAYDQGARIHSNSWGASVPPEYNQYNDRCEQLDTFVWEHKDFLVVVAAGNSGRQTSSAIASIEPMSLDAPGVAKNCLTVGASENGRFGQFPTTYGELDFHRFSHPPFCDATLVDSIDHIAAFSSRGPCRPSQRRKPDVLAPGTFVLSTRSSQLAATNYADAPYLQARYHYMYMHGTSMATPLVAGSAALVREYLRQRRSAPTPSAALVKAALIHSAYYISDGRDQANPTSGCLRNHPGSCRWADCEQGWGRVKLKNVLNPDPPTDVEFIDDAQGLQTGDERTFKVEISDSTVPLRVTLVYTDYPGKNPDKPDKDLVNELNLLLLSPLFNIDTPNRAYRYWGNDFPSPNQPDRTDQRDRTNNVEGVVIEQPTHGVWTVKVIAFDVSEGPQDFALVISGGNLSLK
jgi:serine protease AprX